MTGENREYPEQFYFHTMAISCFAVPFIVMVLTFSLEALRMSVKAIEPDPTQLECTAKIQRLEQKIIQITQECGAVKSYACSSPGTKEHTLIKPVTSKSITSNGPGKGTSKDPYKIANIQDLQKLRSTWKNNRGKYFIVTQNIDLSSIANFAPLPLFEGILDGNNKKILHLKIGGTPSSSQRAGLFQTIARTGQVKNLRLENVLVKGRKYVGGLAGELSGRIDNSYVTGQVLGRRTTYPVGGLVGGSDRGSRITDSYATAKVSGRYSVGGLVGRLSHGSTIQSSYATGNVSGRSSLGGLVGRSGRFGHQNLHIKINNSYATGSVSGRAIIGGLVGDNGGTITKCYAIGQVSGRDNIGGLVGWNQDGRIHKSYVTGQVSGSRYIGGLVGTTASGSRITDSYATAKVSGRHTVGGLVGASYESSTIQSSYATGTVSGQANHIGGLVGLNGGGRQNLHVKINNSYATGDVSGRSIIGGLVGENRGAITKCYAIGQVTSTQSDRVGGLVGEYTQYGRIKNSYGKQQLGTTNTIGAKTDTELKTPSTFTGWDTRLRRLTQNQYPKLKRLNYNVILPHWEIN